MPEGLLENTENPTPMMDVYSPDGTKGKVPTSQWSNYAQQGFKPAVRVTSPSGTGGWLPNDKVADYTKQGFRLGPPDQQKVSPKPAPDPAKDPALTNMMGQGMPTQDDLNPKPSAFLDQAAQNVKHAAQSTGHVLKVGGGTMLKIAADPSPVGIARAFAEEAAEQQAHGGIPRSSDMVAQPLRELAGERQPGESATLGFTGHDPSQQPIIARTATAMSNLMGGDPAGARQHFSQAATLDSEGSRDAASEENQRGTADLTAVPAATVGLGRIIGAKPVQGMAKAVAAEIPAAADSAISAIARPVIGTGDLVMRGIKNVKTAINPVDNMTAGELATKAVRPRNSKTNFPQEMETALPDTKRALQNAGVDQSNMTLHDVLDAATQAKKDVWAEYQQNHSGPSGELPIDTTPIADAMLSKITPRMRTQQPGLVKQIEANAAEYSGKSMAAQELEARVGEANNETRGIEAKYLTDKNAAKLDPNNAALFAERDTARQLLLSKLDEATGPGAAQLRQRYGNLNSFQDVVSRRIPVADRSAPSGLAQILSGLYGPGKIAGGLAQVATGVGAGHGIANIIEGGASMIGAKNAKLMNDPDALIQHAFNKTEATPAARPYVAPPKPPIRGLLPPAPTELPSSVEAINPGREGLLPAASRIDENGRVQYLTSPAEPGAPAPIARPNQQQSAAPVPVKAQEPPQGATEAQQAAVPERRQNVAQRKLVSEMSPEERAKALLSSDVTGMPNRRAFDEAGPAKAVAMSDADGLKAFNDRFGYDAGNELLKAKAEALKEAGLDAYHDKGDEFLGRGESEADLKQKYEKAREILRNREIEVTQADGTVRTFKGADFSYGTGKDLAAAEKGLKTNKAEREASGERARGELRGITEVGPKAGQDNPSAATPPNPIARPPK